MRQRVVIIGIGYTSRLCLIQSVAQIGCEVVVVTLENNDKPPIDSYSKYVSEVINFPQRNGSDQLAHMLVERCTSPEGKAILIPNSDFSVAAIDTHHDILQPHFHLPHIHHKEGAIVEWMDKERQKALAAQLGMKVVNSTNIDIVDGVYHIPQGMRYPCFTKTRAYTPGNKTTLYRCNDENELRQALDEMAGRLHTLTVMVEDFKEIETEYAVLGFSDGEHVVIPGIIEMIQMTEGKDKGVAMYGKVTPTSHLQHLIDQFATFVQTIGLVGLFDIDFYLSDGEYYFDELNLRTGGSCAAITKMGVNLPGMLVKSLRNESIADMPSAVTSTATFANERTCTESWSDGYLPSKDFLHILRHSDIRFLDDPDDPMPGKVFHRQLRVMRAKRCIKNMLRWVR